MIQFYLDNVLINTPKYKSLKEVIELDTDLNAWVHHFDEIELEFSGDGYKYLKSKKDQYGFNYRAEIRIEITPQNLTTGSGDTLNGYIYLTDIDIDHLRKVIKAPIVEKFFLGTIKQNQKSIVYFDDLVKTLNNETLTDTPDEQDVDMFDPADGTLICTVHGIELSSVIASCVGYITDNSVDFQDNYFSTLGKLKYLLCNGNQVRTQDTSVTRIKTSDTFDMIMDNCYKLFNLWWYIDYSHLKPKFIIDTWNNIIDSQGGIELEAVKGMKESFNQDAFYTSIRIGSDKYTKPPQPVYTSYLQFINGYTHHEELFTSKNNTLIDNELNLVCSWIIDHNIFQRVLVDFPNDPIYDDSNFLIQWDNTMGQAYPSTFANLETDTRALYNEQLLNINRLKRFRLPMELGFESGLTNNNFEARITSDISYTGITATSATITTFNDEITDPNSNYNTTLYKYTTPTAPDIIGNYGFDFALQVFIDGVPASPDYACIGVKLELLQFWSSGTQKAEYNETWCIFDNTGPEGFQCIISRNFFMAVGDYVKARYTISSGVNPTSIGNGPSGIFTTTSPFVFDATIFGSDSFFKTSYVQNQGGLITGPADIKNYHGGIIEFKKNLPLSTWKTLKNNSIQSITPKTGDGKMVECKIKEIKRDVLTGSTEWTLMTKESKVGL